MKTSKTFYIIAGLRENGLIKKYFWGVGGKKGLSDNFNNAKHYNTFLQASEDALYVYAVHQPEEIIIRERY